MEFGLVWLMRAGWIAALLPIAMASIPCRRLSSLQGILLGFAKRGKTMQSSSQKFTVPQRFFSHFYAVSVLWTTLLLVTTWVYAYKTSPLVSEQFQFSDLASQLTGGSHTLSFHKSQLTPLEHRFRVWCSVLLLLLMEVHSLRRLIESLYVSKYSPSARMHINGYLAGLFYYVATPLSLCCSFAPEVSRFTMNLMAEFVAKGKSQMSAPEFHWEYASPLLKLGWCQWIGATIFLWGWIHQFRCHSVLGSLRQHANHVNEYVIPHGDWFELVSSPHYLAEIVIYAGLLVTSGGADLTIWLLFVFVAGNLSLAAAETHRWYLRKFENYPRSRHVIIPFIF
ncbi:polyprenol reductase 2 isoform X3 [Carica papaya]|uniref:polyprenol reductase 2 isoform X3 n=1 Tax=Carica papaya TaxID=3649 RepID=UPI000B8CE53C|nr:polyprenol reductase 2 isoform X3 [Carica papaya]